MENMHEPIEKQNNAPHIVLGILAHVDAGKTTLSESILYHRQVIRDKGRVDHGNSFLDTDEMERKRGITIFFRQARFDLGRFHVTLLDTPGHVDFSAEMERTLQVLDYAVLVISASDGVQSHTRTLWKLFESYQIPVFIFMNKMDQPLADRERLLRDLQQTFGEECFDFAAFENGDEKACEAVAMTDEKVMENFLEGGDISEGELIRLIYDRKVFPCFFGSALKDRGVEEFCESLGKYLYAPLPAKEFGARIFKIERDEQGNRLTHMKITGGSLSVKEELFSEDWESPQKVNQLRLYQGQKFSLSECETAGSVVAVTGLSFSRAGEGLGFEKWKTAPQLAPVLGYRVEWPAELSARTVLEKLRILEEENPELTISWEEELEEIHVQLMGDVQIEVLRAMVQKRFGFEITFSEGDVIYKETIADEVEGVGHFEPLRHYAEVHLLLSPLPRGSGLVFDSQCRTEELAVNWQRLVLTHLGERTHRGVLTGAPITDMKLSVIAGRAHNKHTEGGDFRQASYRAVRQGLMQAESILLEPYFSFRIDVPIAALGHVLTDLERMAGKCSPPLIDEETAIVTGKAPVSTLKNYAKELLAFTKGMGRISLVYAGYDVCHNTDEVLSQKGYDPERDLRNTADSVFCAHGSSVIIPWDEVFSHMHVESPLKKENEDASFEQYALQRSRTEQAKASAKPKYGQEEKELREIFERTYGAIRQRGPQPGQTVYAGGEAAKKKGISDPKYEKKPKPVLRERYLLVDGYNIIFAWDELRELAAKNIDAARGRLMDIMSNFQGTDGAKLILVFDAYRVKGNLGVMRRYHNIDVVYTKEAETADQYIEKATHRMRSRDCEIRVATSDGLEQLIVWGQGCLVLSARQLKEEVQRARETLQDWVDNESSE